MVDPSEVTALRQRLRQHERYKNVVVCLMRAVSNEHEVKLLNTLDDYAGFAAYLLGESHPITRWFMNAIPLYGKDHRVIASQKQVMRIILQHEPPDDGSKHILPNIEFLLGKIDSQTKTS